MGKDVVRLQPSYKMPRNSQKYVVNRSDLRIALEECYERHLYLGFVLVDDFCKTFNKPRQLHRIFELQEQSIKGANSYYIGLREWGDNTSD